MFAMRGLAEEKAGGLKFARCDKSIEFICSLAATGSMQHRRIAGFRTIPARMESAPVGGLPKFTSARC
jgi:hypothetical protein